MPRKNPETKFKEKVVEDIKSISCYHYKTQEVSVRGILDITMSLGGRFIAIELKVDSPLSELQKRTIHKIKTKGEGIAIVATPHNWKEIFQLLKERKWEQLQKLDHQSNYHSKT